MDVRLLLVPVEPLDVVLLPLVDVDGVGVDAASARRSVSTSPITRAPVGSLASMMTTLSPAAVRRLISSAGIGLGRPVPGLAGVVQDAVRLRGSRASPAARPAERVAVLERQLEGGALQVVHQDQQVVRIDQAVLRRAVEEVVGVLHDELIERR